MISRILAGCWLAVAAGFFASGADAQPLILPTPLLKAGRPAGMEVVPPHDARACALSLRAAHRRVGPYRLSLGGPTRFVVWKVPPGASGSWRATMRCRGRHGAPLGAASHRLVVGHRGATIGSPVVRGSLHVRHGSIPEMPSQATASRLALAFPAESGGDVNTNDQRPGFQFAACRSSQWMDKTRTIGDGLATEIQFEPTANARANAIEIQRNLIEYYLSSRESYYVYGEMWNDLNRCASFPSSLTTSMRHALYEQMACHARYGVASTRFTGGNTWDLEAWRREVDWDVALDPSNRCQGGAWGNVDAGTPPASTYISGLNQHLVHSSLDTATQLEAWLIVGRQRRPVDSAQAYFCLTGAGRAPAKLYPGSFLNDYFGQRGDVIRSGEACGSTAPVRPGSGAAPALVITGSCTTQGGTLTGTSSGFTAGGTATIRAWYPGGAEYTNLVHTSRVRADGSISWTWPCQGDPAGTYTTTAVDDVSGTSTGVVHFTIGAAQVQPPQQTWSEQETPNHPVNTFTNYHNASGVGPQIAAGQWVQVSCKVYDPFIASVNPDGYWYRIASSPWSNAYYSPANTFMNGDPYGGPYTHNTDYAVPNC